MVPPLDRRGGGIKRRDPRMIALTDGEPDLV